MHKSLWREHNAGIPGMLISTSCVFSPIARYNFLSDEAEEQFDTHQLSHDARKDAYPLLYLALTTVGEGEGKVIWCVFPAFMAFLDAQPQKNSHIPHSLRLSAIVPWKERVLCASERMKDSYWSASVKREDKGVCWWEEQSVDVLYDRVVVWSSVYSVSLSFVVHKNRKIKALEGVGSAWRRTDACVTSCSKASGFLATVHLGIQVIPKHRQLRFQRKFVRALSLLFIFIFHLYFSPLKVWNLSS